MIFVGGVNLRLGFLGTRSFIRTPKLYYCVGLWLDDQTFIFEPLLALLPKTTFCSEAR